MRKEQINITKNIMEKIEKGEVKMKPKVYFVLGSIITLAGLISFFVVSVFFINLILFYIRARGPMAQFRIEESVNNFPWWILIIAVTGIFLGIFSLRKYDFSYSRNFPLIVIGFVLSIIIAAFMVDQLGLNEALQRGPIKRLYGEFRETRKERPGFRMRENPNRYRLFFNQP